MDIDIVIVILNFYRYYNCRFFQSGEKRFFLSLYKYRPANCKKSYQGAINLSTSSFSDTDYSLLFLSSNLSKIKERKTIQYWDSTQ